VAREAPRVERRHLARPPQAAHRRQVDALRNRTLLVQSVAHRSSPFGICWAWINFLGLIYVVYYYLVRRFDPFHLTLLGATAGVVVGAVIAALSGISMAVCLVILMFAPAVTVVGSEVRGYRHQAAALLN
jgi:hypothetical protein